ncbi:phage tail tape measure protein [Oceanobacillus caeni]|uniref:phage tail tape measure protein n=1 Tax=Oceanobacillus caeni TaxID=405946 RepID=UPI00214A3ADC|nr:phage tail tape measure protein [Oceanobacillus caeni]MCR1834969.1 phage tail tape measure protein [Oceanobacillus caeni]
MAIGGTPVGNMVIKVDLDSTGVEKSMTGLQRQLKSSNKAMGAQLSAFSRGEKSAQKYGVLIEGLSNRHRIQARMVEEARKKYQSMSSQYGENSVKAQKASQELNEQIARYQETSRELDNVTAEFKEFQRVQEIQSKGWYKVADGMENYGGKMKAAGRQMTDFGKSYTLRVTTPIVAGGVAMFKAASDYESAFAGVRKTVDMSEQGYAKLSKGIRNMSKELPASASEIASVAEAAGQLGIENDSILSFTRTIIDLGESTNLSLEQASSEFARFANIVGMSQKDFDRLGSSVVALGNTMATTESEIMSMAMRLAAQGKQVGMTEAQIMALSATMSSLGIEAEAGGTAMTTVLKKIDKAVGEGGKSLSGFAKAAGVSSKDFANAWKKDPVKALDMFIKGLNKSSDEGKNLTTILSDLGIKGIRESDTILRMAGASDILSEAVNTSTSAWEENSALTEEAAERYKTTESQLKMLRNRIKDMGITLGNALIPAVLDAIDAAEPFIKKIEEGAQAFADMDKEQQQTILKMIALVAALGPASIGMGQLSLGIGGVLQAGGKLTKTLGMAGGTGTLGAISGLGKAGVAGLAIAGVGALGVSVYKLIEKSKEAKEVNLDVAKSLNDQASELENSANTFDKLAGKAKISNEQLAELNDLNIRISQSSNPGEINELQKQYDALAKKSGLSKDELNRLFEANANIIEQSPNVQASVSETGNKFAENTNAVRKYINSLHEATLIELEAERTKSLEQEKVLRGEITDKQNELNGLLERMGVYTSSIKLSEDEIAARIEEINGLYRDSNLSVEEKNRLQQEQTALLDIQNGKYSEAIEDLQSQVDKKRESIGATEEELEKINVLNEQMANLVLKQAGINTEGEKGLAQLDQSIAKNNEELIKLEEKRQKNGELTEEEQKRYDKLSQTNQKQLEAKQYLFDTLGIYKDINSLAEFKLQSLSKEQQQKIANLAKTTEIKVEEGNIVKQIENKNKKLLEERTNLEENRKKQGANKQEIDKQISSIDKKIGKNDDVLVQILKEIGVWDQVKGSIDLSSKKINDKNKKIDAGTGKLNKQGSQIDSNNSKTDKGIKKEQERTKEAGKSVDKIINAKDNNTVANIDKRATAPKDKRVSVKDFGTIANLNARASQSKDKLVKLTPGSTLATLNSKASSPVTKVVNFVGKGLSKLKFWAKGTPPSGHPGGMAVVGDGGGRELIQTPSGATFLSPDTDTLLDLPKGTHVIPHRETERLLKSAPRYAEGTNNWSELFSFDNLRNSELMRLLALNGKSETKVRIKSERSESKDYTQDLLNATLEQNKILMQLLAKDNNIYFGEKEYRELGKRTEPHITKQQQRKQFRQRRSPGFA